MKPFYWIIIAAVLCPAISLAQKFKPGYVISLKGDTLKGLVSYSQGTSKAHYLLFKNSATGTSQKFTPANVLSFHIADDEYHRYSGFITKDRILEDVMAESRDTSGTIDTVFIKVLQKGKVLTLYTFSDDLKTRFYYTEKDNEMPVELIYRVYFDLSVADPATGKGRTVNEDTYLKMLYALAMKHNLMDNKLQWMFDNARYDKAYLIPITKYMNGVKS